SKMTAFCKRWNATVLETSDSVMHAMINRTPPHHSFCVRQEVLGDTFRWQFASFISPEHYYKTIPADAPFVAHEYMRPNHPVRFFLDLELKREKMSPDFQTKVNDKIISLP